MTTPTSAGRSQSSRVKSFGSLEPSSSELLNYSGWCGFLTWVLQGSLEEGCSQMTSVSFSLGATNPQLGLGRLFIAREQPTVKGHKCPCMQLLSCPRI